jgi:RNA polymerase sigma factor (sigma-70 family)
MGHTQLGSPLSQVWTVIASESARALRDRELLDRFLASADEGAFAELIRRHGPLVLRVCRLVLAQEQDAEDAFQVTFLLLARNAASIQKKEALAAWLHGVAHRTALAARRAAARRRRHERQAQPMPQRNPATELAWWEVQTILGEEVERLPAVYRAPFALCCLEGKSQAEAARELGLKEGTVSSRLNRARARLKERLARRGIDLSAVLGAVFVAQEGRAAVPGALARTTAAGAARYAAGAGLGESVSVGAADLLRRMLTGGFLGQTRWRGLLVLVFCALFSGVGLYGPRAGAGKRSDADGQIPPKAPVRAGADRPDGDQALRLDVHGDALPAGALVRFGSVRLPHGAPVCAVAFSPDGKLIASGGGSQRAGYGDPTASLWDAATGKELQRLKGHVRSVCAVAFAPEGTALATASMDGTVRLWQTATGKELRCLQVGQPIRTVAFSPSGKVLASGGADRVIRLWDMATGTELHRLPGHRTAPAGIVFTPDGKTLISAGMDGTIRLWEVATGKPLRYLGNPVDPSLGIALAPDGRTLAAACSGVVVLWEVASGKLLHVLNGHPQGALCVAFSADGRTLASGGADNTIRLWDPRTGRQRRQLVGHTGGVNGLAFAPNGKSLVSAGAEHTLRLWDVAGGAERLPTAGHHGYVGVLAFSGAGTRLATAGQDGMLHFWETATGKHLRRFPGQQSRGKAVAFTTDGKLLAAGRRDGTIRLLDTASGREIRQFGTHEDPVLTVVFSPDGKYLASAGFDRMVCLWDWHTGKQVRALQAHQGTIPALSFSGDGALLASGSNDGSLALWKVATGEVPHRLRGGGTPAVEAVVFSPDGRILASGGQEPVVRLWSVRSGKEVAQLSLPGGGWINSIAFSADGRLLAANNAGRPGVIVWEVATRRERVRFTGHRGAVVAVSFAPEGTRLVSGSADGTAVLWDLGGRGPAGNARATKLSAAALTAAWHDLAETDAGRAYRTVLALVATGGQAPELVRRHLRPVSVAEGKRLAECVKDLGQGKFAERERAMRLLEKLGGTVEPALRKVLESPPSLEVRRRLEQLLDQLTTTIPPPEQLRALRALEVLERLATPEALEILEALARGAPEAALTHEARGVLQRLALKTRPPR